MEETLFVSFEPRELQFATSQSRNENSLLMAWCASSALGQGCDGTPTGSHPWGKLSGGGRKRAPSTSIPVYTGALPSLGASADITAGS